MVKLHGELLNVIHCSSLVSEEKINVPPISTHEEVDTRLIFHARMNNEASVTVTKDPNLFLLLIYFE